MTYDYGTGQPADGDTSRTDAAKDAAKDAAHSAKDAAHTAKDEAANVASSAKDSGMALASEAKTQAAGVTAEAKAQAGDVLRASREEMTAQAGVQQHKLAGGLRAFGGELSTMADASDSGMAGDLTRQLADRVSGVASWLDEREPGELLNEVKTFARDKPGTFLALAAGAGLLAGRLTRGIKDAPAAPSAEDTAAAGFVGGSTADTTGYSSTTPTRTSAFATGTAGAATGAAYGASADDTAVYGTGAVAGGTASTLSNESSHWDDAVASTSTTESTTEGYGTAEGSPLAGVEATGASQDTYGQSAWSDTASAPGYGTDHMEETAMSTTPEHEDHNPAAPEREDNPGAYGGGAQNVPAENEQYGNEEGGALGGGTTDVPEHETHQVWSPVHEQNREEDHR